MGTTPALPPYHTCTPPDATPGRWEAGKREVEEEGGGVEEEGSRRGRKESSSIACDRRKAWDRKAPIKIVAGQGHQLYTHPLCT